MNFVHVLPEVFAGAVDLVRADVTESLPWDKRVE